jgi:hypothetical protein
MKMIKNDLKNMEKHSQYLVSLLIQLGLTHSGMLYSVFKFNFNGFSSHASQNFKMTREETFMMNLIAFVIKLS